MNDFAPQQPEAPTRIPTSEYLRLIETGVLGQDDRVELLGAVIVAMAPSDPSHATATMRATALYRDTRVCAAGDALELAALPGARVAVAELLPARS